MEGIDIDAISQGVDFALRGLASMLEEVRAAGDHGFLGHPDDGSVELVIGFGDVTGSNDHISATAVDFGVEDEGNRLGGEGFGLIAIEGDDAFDVASLSGGEDHDFIPLADDAGGHGSAEAAEIEVGSVDVLHGESEVFEVSIGADIDGLEEVHEGTAAVPRHMRAGVDDVIAVQGGDGDEVEVGEVESGGEFPIVIADAFEFGLPETDEVHLVDGDDHVSDTEERDDEAVSFGLGEDAVAGIDEDDS